MFIGVIFIIIIYSVLNLYMAKRYLPIFRAVIPKIPYWCIAVVFLVPALSYAAPYLFPLWDWVRAAGVIGAYWMGFFAYSMLFFVILEIPRYLLLRRLHKKAVRHYSLISAGAVMLLCVALMIGGRLHANNIVKVSYDVPMERGWDGPSLKVALLSDVHLGHINGVKKMEQIVEAINEQQVDLVCIAGDLFDSSYEGVREPERIAQIMGEIESKYGVFLCWGNHDAGTGFADMEELMEKAGVHMLKDEAFRIEGVCTIAGRRDSAPIGGQDAAREPWKREDGEEPVLVLDHRPSNADEYENVDLVLSGHTHAGQIFPFSLATGLAEPYNYGYYTTDKGVPLIVTSGIGTWGPPLRIGSDSELAIIQLREK